MSYDKLSLVPRAPDLGPGAWDPRWGDRRTTATHGAEIRAAVVASVDQGSRAERAQVPHDPQRGPIPMRVNSDAMQNLRVAQKLRAPYTAQRMTDRVGYVRPVWSLRHADALPIDKLFNHPGGLRGHYAESPEAGDGCQRRLITALLPLLRWSARVWHAENDDRPPLLDDPAILEESALAGKVWMEPYRDDGPLYNRALGNRAWVHELHDGAYGRRQAFVAELRRRLGGDDAKVAAFLRAAANPQEGMMGTTEHLPGWSIQAAGATSMGPRGTLQVMGTWIRGHGDTVVADRKVHRALSIHMFGFT